MVVVFHRIAFALSVLLWAPLAPAQDDNTDQFLDNLYKAQLSWDAQISAEHLARAKLFLQTGADVNAVAPRHLGKEAYTHFKNQPILAEMISESAHRHDAAVAEMWQDLALMTIQRGANLNAKFGNEYWRSSPFRVALSSGNPRIVEAMLERDPSLAKVQFPVFRRESPALYLALTGRNLRSSDVTKRADAWKVVDLVIAAGADVESTVPNINQKEMRDARQSLPLATYFGAMGSLEAFRYLIQHGARITKKDIAAIRAYDKYCRTTYGSIAPFKSGVPLSCEKVQHRQEILALAEEQVAAKRTNKFGTTH